MFSTSYILVLVEKKFVVFAIGIGIEAVEADTDVDYCTYLSGPTGYRMRYMRIRMRMGDVDGDGSYLYVCRYVYVCICAYLMQCVMLSRLYGFVGRQYCT